jgi:hypothetical protein
MEVSNHSQASVNSFPRALPQLHAERISLSVIAAEDISQMYLLMRKYYDNMTEEQFIKDLKEKNDVILLRDPELRVRGFSTLLKQDIPANGGSVRAIFSGDTVVDREFWGQKVLGMAFLRYLFIEKCKNPFTPLYWMLMSKGYKTYLLMANNFRTHYPRYEKPMPGYIRNIVDGFYGSRYGLAYRPETGVIQSYMNGVHLREGIAPIEPELIRKFPRVRFFTEQNPQWAKGHELACIAEMTLGMPFYYFFKKLFGRRQKPSNGK